VQTNVPEGESFVGYNCDFCIAREMMGNRTGRVCLTYQVDFSEDALEYYSFVKGDQVSGRIVSYEDFYHAIDKLLTLHKTDRIELALKFIKIRTRNGVISGVCPKSFPRTQLTLQLLSKLNLCIGGPNGTDLIHLPFPGTLFDQQNLFVEAYFVYCDEYNKYIKTQKTQKDRPNAQTNRP